MEPLTALAKPDLWAQFGPMGLVSLALFAFLWRMLDTHRAERREMREEANIRANQLMTLQRETNLAMQGLTMAIERGNEHGRRGGDHEP